MDVWEDESASRPSLVLTNIADSIALVSLNRPDRLNAWTSAMGTQYFDTLTTLARDKSVKAIVVTGAGRAFCAGADGSGLGNMAANGGLPAKREVRPYWFPMSIGKPIIAAINGACMGVGLQQALCCDLRFVAEDAKISTVYARRGLIGEVGITWTLPRIVGTGAAMDLLISGRVIRGEEALRMGLANRVFAPDALLEGAMSYARELAENCAPSSMRTLKQQLYSDLMHNLSEAFDQSEKHLADALASKDFAEGIKSWQEKRPPQFAPLADDLAIIDLASASSGRKPSTGH